MRWDELFADLEGQLEAGLGAEERDAQAEEERLRLGRLTLRDRCTALRGERIRARITTGEVVDLVPRTVGRDWVAGDLAGSGAQAVLPLASIDALLLDAGQLERSGRPTAPATTLTDRLGIAFVLRDLARRRRTLAVVTARGILTGTLDGVGADHLQLAVHPSGEWRRPGAVARVELVPLARVVLVRVD